MPEMTCTNHPGTEGSIVRCARCLRPFCGDCLVRLGGRPLCADCKVEQVLDAQSGVSTTTLELATLGRRLMALFIDGLVVGMPMMILIFAVMIPKMISSAGTPEAMPPWFNFIGFVQIPFMIVYEGLMMSRRDGQTLGKIALHLRVVRPDGSPISSGQAWGRAAVRSLLASFLSLLNYIPAFFTKEKTPLHDMAAKTRVIYLG
jgi:uncharacterized RDD family membrane protein YckC